MTRSEMIQSLQKHDCRVIFKKQSTGEEREMICTLREDAVPAAEKDEPISQKKVRSINEEVIPVWDIDKQSWRSFRVDSVISFTYSG